MNLLVKRETITPQVIRDNVYTSLKRKVSQLEKALDGYFSEHHRFILEQSLAIYDFYQRKIQQLEERIEYYLTEYEREVEILESILGIDQVTASVFLAEVGTDMNQFPTVG